MVNITLGPALIRFSAIEEIFHFYTGWGHGRRVGDITYYLFGVFDSQIVFVDADGNLLLGRGCFHKTGWVPGLGTKTVPKSAKFPVVLHALNLVEYDYNPEKQNWSNVIPFKPLRETIDWSEFNNLKHLVPTR